MRSDGPRRPAGFQLGLRNAERRYLTAESFGFTVNASAPSLKRKQLWTLEQAEAPGPAAVFLRSHLGRYLGASADGRVSCQADRPGPDQRFLVAAQPDGRWALRSEPHGRFLGGSEDRLSCFAPAVTAAELWTVHLAAPPQAHLLSVSRRRYVRLGPRGDEVTADGDTPWGVGALLTLVFRDPHHCLRTCDGRYLRQDGRLVREAEPRARYTLELRAGRLAFRDGGGRYLTPAGPAGALRAGRGAGPAKDELFVLEGSPPQVVFVASNRRYLSIRQGINVSANQDEELDLETFQMRIDPETKKRSFRSNAGTYWTLVTHGGIQSTATQLAANTMFEMEWRGRRVALKASNGRYVCTKKNGQLAAVSHSVGQDEEFTMKVTNRPVLVLRGSDGFVCQRRGSNLLDANRSVYDAFPSLCADGAYHIRGQGGRFWYAAANGSVCSDGERPEDFFFEFPEVGRVAIKAKNGRYLRGAPSGALRADGDALACSTLWEY
ncbi:fascin-2 [Tachyglossus aculeatus]|uniref:fascin-2 n=1 Tax=Tachyglossus aculeatus TaxID=9261 RepID=UPI0018F53A88|nr:fascin-2 [Tachyglossus aculeatus]